jgi:hypothetical protein
VLSIHSLLHQRILFTPNRFLELEISTATAESRWGLALFTLPLCLHLKAALFFVHLFLIEKIIKNASTGGKPDQKLFNRGIFWIFSMYCIQHCFICRHCVGGCWG